MSARMIEGQKCVDPHLQWVRFPDGGSYVGPVSSDLAQGLGLSVGPRDTGEFGGLYQAGYETLGVLRSFVVSETNGQVKSGCVGNSYSGEWSDGRRHGLGIDIRDGWVYRGEWTQGFRGRYGVRKRVDTTVGYEGTWTSGVQDGFGVETYGDGSWYCGQWLKGMRHGYGIRQSSTYQNASKYRSINNYDTTTTPLSQSKRSNLLRNPADTLIFLRDQRILSSSGGFVLLAETSFPPLPRKRGLLIDRHGRPSLSKTISHQFKPKAAAGAFSRTSSVRSVDSRKSGGSLRGAFISNDTSGYVDDDTTSFISVNTTGVSSALLPHLKETYLGEWKDDRRNGYGVCRRSDGLKYEGEWMNNQKNGYGCTTLPDGTKISGKYRNNVLITSSNVKSLLAPFRGNKLNDRTVFAVEEATRAARYAQEKEEIARTRMKGARERADQAEVVAGRASVEAEAARNQAARFTANNQSSNDAQVLIHRLSEREFYMEIDPADKDFLFTGTQSVKKKRFPLALGRSRTGSLITTEEHEPSGLSDFVCNQIDAAPRPHSQFDTIESSEFVSEPTLSSSQFQPSYAENSKIPVQPQVFQPPTYTFETTTPQTNVNRLSSVPAYNHFSEYEPSEVGRTRRKSLPSIVKEKIVEEPSPAAIYDASIDPDLPVVKKSNNSKGMHMSSAQNNAIQKPNVKRIDTYIIENGVRKLVKKTRESPAGSRKNAGDKTGGALSSLIRSSFNAASAAPRAHLSLEEQFNDMYKTETTGSAWKKGRGSTPDIAAALNVKIPPREEVYVLSQRRREEIIQERATQERIRKNHIVLSLIDMKRWLAGHYVLVLFCFINALLAVLLIKS